MFRIADFSALRLTLAWSTRPSQGRRLAAGLAVALAVSSTGISQAAVLSITSPLRPDLPALELSVTFDEEQVQSLPAGSLVHDPGGNGDDQWVLGFDAVLIPAAAIEDISMAIPGNWAFADRVLGNQLAPAAVILFGELFDPIGAALHLTGNGTFSINASAGVGGIVTFSDRLLYSGTPRVGYAYALSVAREAQVPAPSTWGLLLAGLVAGAVGRSASHRS